MKKGLLSAYSITPESSRQSFRNLTKTPTQTHLEFASDKLRAFKKWFQTSTVTTYDELVNLVVLEEFKRKVSFPIRLHIDDRDETDLLKAAEIADIYALTHRASGKRKGESNHIKASAGISGGGKSVESDNKSRVDCSFCRKPEHLIKNCRNLKCKIVQGQTFTKPIVTSVSLIPNICMNLITLLVRYFDI